MADIEKLVHSVPAVVIYRLSVMILPFLLAALGWLSIDLLSGIKENQTRIWTTFGASTQNITQTLSEIKSDLKVSNAQFNAHVQSDDRIDSDIKASLADHEQRIRLLQANRSFLPSTAPLKPLNLPSNPN